MAAGADLYISVRNWRRFQHYNPAIRVPPWIKMHLALLADRDYLNLSLRLRGLLHGIWMAYAESRCELGWSSAEVGLRVGDSTVRLRDLEALKKAGFLNTVASKTLADGYQVASTEVEVEVDLPKKVSKTKPSSNGRKRTGYRLVRGSHGVSYLPDPDGTDPLPAGWAG